MALGAAVATSVLVAALVVGDSARYSLQRLAFLRLGRVSLAMSLSQRCIGAGLAGALQAPLHTPVVPVLRLNGVTVRRSADPSADRQANRVRILGVPAGFWALAARSGTAAVGPGETVLGERLARVLDVRPGDDITLRIVKPRLLAYEAPLAARTDRAAVHVSVTVQRVLTDEEMGRFSLEANQVAPLNAFVDLAWLQQQAGLTGQANMFLIGGAENATVTTRAADAALRQVWQLPQVGYRIWEVPEAGVLQLDCDRVYLDRAVASAALSPATSSGGFTGAVGTLTYLVNSLATTGASGERRTPYSFMSACAPSANRRLSLVPMEMRDDEILVNRWLADHVGATTGGTVRVAYYELTAGGRFVECTRSFTVRGILGMADVARERDMVPSFPGLTDVESCSAWDVGLPMNAADLADKDNEAYWAAYGPTPKAFVTLAAGRAMWGNRFGDLMAVRYPAQAGLADRVLRGVGARVDPAALGLAFQPVREIAARAAGQGVDLGALFLGLSLFLIAAALLLTGLLFVLTVEQRQEEVGTLRALGFRAVHLRWLFGCEGALIATVGGLTGTALGAGYAHLLIWGLAHGWQGAVAHAAIQYHTRLATLELGFGLGAAVSLGAMLTAIWRHTHRPPIQALQPGSAAQSGNAAAPALRRPWSLWIAGLGVALAAGIVVAASVASSSAVEAFFTAGALLLLSGLAAFRHILRRLDRDGGARTLNAFGLRQAARRPGRSLAVSGALACACFLVVAVSSMREDFSRTQGVRASGTGGFAWIAESTVSVPEDLNTARGIRWLTGRVDPWPAGVRFIGLKARDGDDASCLNLNRAQSPQLLGVDPAALSALGAFAGGSGQDPWRLLTAPQTDGAVPALAGDATTAEWGLGKRVGPVSGDTLDYADDEGRPFKVRLAGQLPMRLSLFQGALLVPLADFSLRYPAEGGARVFLVDLPRDCPAGVRAELKQRLNRAGMDVTDTVARLQEFYAVESTYLAMFLVLGGVGVLLGSLGLGILVFRNVSERRGELAMLRSVGFSRRQIAGMVLAEHRLLLCAGLLSGLVAAGVAVGPSLLATGAQAPWGTLALIVGALVAGGFAWTAAAARLVLGGDLLTALRND